MITRDSCSSVSGQLVRFEQNGEIHFLVTRNFGTVHVKGYLCDRFGRVDTSQEEICVRQTDITPVMDLALPPNQILLRVLGDRHDELIRQKYEAEKVLAEVTQKLAELEQECSKLELSR